MSNEPRERPRGLVIVYTGDGKGKTTAALGTLFRAMGYGYRVAVVQFIKGKWKTGERRFADKVSGCVFDATGLGFTWDSNDLSSDEAAARRGWETARSFVTDEDHRIVVLDELTYAINYGFCDLDEIVQTIRSRPPWKTVIVTGRNASRALLDVADLVTEMKAVKHPYQVGIPAQKGVDF